jgi:hypothetical protein
LENAALTDQEYDSIVADLANIIIWWTSEPKEQTKILKNLVDSLICLEVFPTKIIWDDEGNITL